LGKRSLPADIVLIVAAVTRLSAAGIRVSHEEQAA